MATEQSDIQGKTRVDPRDHADIRRRQIEFPRGLESYREANRRIVLVILLAIVPLAALSLVFGESPPVLSFFTLAMLPVVTHYFGSRK